MDMVIETVDYTIKEGSEEDFSRIFATLQKSFRETEGAMDVRLFRDNKDKNRFLLFMQWESEAGLEATRANADFDVWRLQSREMTGGPSVPRFYSETL